MGEAGGIIRNVLVGLTAIIFLLAGLTYVYASYIIPEAAKQLEKETKELAPQLWQEYEAKLEEGEVLAMRPELMQELGAKMQPYIERKILEQQGGGAPPASDMGTSSSTVVDVEVVQDDKSEEKK